MDDLRYPTGRFSRPDQLTEAERRANVDIVAATPERLRAALQGLTDEQLGKPYRPGGWTLRQVAHHVPDSHVNAYIRFKLALTEDAPVITLYDEAAWAKLEDSRSAPVETSLVMLESIHDRWVRILRAMSPADFSRKLNHPEHGMMSLDQMLALYAWHGPHHIAHVTTTRALNGWG
jgi:DinB superfamily